MDAWLARVLHFANGETTAALLAASGIGGDVTSADDITMEGPIVQADAGPAALLARARWLEARFDIAKGEYLARVGRLARAAQLAPKYPEAVVWTEPDVFCQLNALRLIQLLCDTGARVSLATPPQGRLGRLAPTDFPPLFSRRVPLDDAARDACARALRALAAPDPRGIADVAASFTARAPWPGLQDALLAHMRRFPSTRNGLGAIEDGLARLVAAAPRPLADIMRAFGDDPRLDAYGMADTQVLARLRWLSTGQTPLVAVDDPRAAHDPAIPGVWSATPLGRAVTAGETDAVEARGVDDWVGGVRLVGPSAVWRWDEAAGRLVASGP